MPTSERATIVQDLYNLYLSEAKDRKMENWRRYIKYLKHYHLADTEKEQKVFKKTKGTCGFIKEMDIKTFCWRLSHLKKNADLYYILSVAKSEKPRGTPYSKTILGSIKNKI
jgi:sugar phosphate isomerase/epimerase